MSSRCARFALSPGAILAGAALALWPWADGRAGEIPRDKRVIDIDEVPGTLGAVRFPHAAHAKVGWRADHSLMTCRDCHHNLEADEPTDPSGALRCGACHPPVGEPDRIVEGRRARALARLKPDGAIDYRTLLFHDYCLNCHKKVQGGELKLTHCKLCHPGGVGPATIHGRFDGIPQKGGELTWLRCPAGQRWSGRLCEGTAALVTAAQAERACPEGCHLPSRAEFAGVLDGCPPEVASGRPGTCRPCEQSATCSRLLGSDAGTYWVAAAGGPGSSVVRLSDGAFLAVPEDARAAVRCVQRGP